MTDRTHRIYPPTLDPEASEEVELLAHRVKVSPEHKVVAVMLLVDMNLKKITSMSATPVTSAARADPNSQLRAVTNLTAMNTDLTYKIIKGA